MSFTEVHACRSCGSTELFPVLDLGVQPLANALRRPGDESPEPRFPLAVQCCATCSLVQLTGTVDPHVLFDSYHYFSSFSTTMVDAMAALAARLVADRGLGAGDLVVEVASNDGYLLRHYADLGIPVLGIDPAANVAEVARERGVPTEVAYFGTDVAERLASEGRRAAVLHANNVLAHVPDVNDFVAGIAHLLADDGVAVIETPHLLPFVEHTEFDTVYHEHVFYYSLTALEVLFGRHGLVVVDVEPLPIHGGSLRLTAARAGRPEPSGAAGERVAAVRAAEAAAGVATPAFYDAFADRVAALRTACLEDLHRRRDAGQALAGYGAAAKGTVLLNHFGIDHSLLSFVVDRNHHKQGLLVPGVHIPIDRPERLVEDQPDATLLLTWNFADEIVQQQAAYLAAGGRFLIPVPTFREVGS